MNPELNELTESLDLSIRRRLAMWFVRWVIGFSIVAIVTWYYPDTGWLWLAAVIVALLSLVMIIGTQRYIQRQIGQVAGAQEELAQLLVPENELLAEKLLGGWSLETDQGSSHITGTTHYLEDGKWEAVIFFANEEFTTEVDVKGRWEVKGKNLRWQVNISSDPDLMPIGLSQTEEILAINEESKTYRDPEGVVWTESRVREAEDN